MERIILAILIIGVTYLLISVWILRTLVDKVCKLVREMPGAIKRNTELIGKSYDSLFDIIKNHLKKHHDIVVEDKE